MRLVPLISCLVGLATACFCPTLISTSCGCGGGSYSPYAGGGYGGGGYANTGSYAVFYRDLTPFRQPYYQQAPAYPQYYPRAPAQALPPMYQLPNPRFIQPQAPPPPPPPQYIPRPTPVVAPTLVQEHQIYIQPAATVAPIAEIPRTTLHDNGYGEEEEIVVTTVAPIVTVPTTVDEVPDFVDEPATKAVNGEKDEFYYVYYDDKGNKVGDSRSGTTFAPENVILEEATTIAPASVDVTTQSVPQEQVVQNYDDVVEETQMPARTSLATAPAGVETTTLVQGGTEIVYEDETVEYEDDGQGVTEGPITKKPTSTGGVKRTVQDNQILVDAAQNPQEQYRFTANGVKNIERRREEKKKIHEN